MENVTVIDLITHTPFWVWAALVALLWLGVKRAQAREVTLSRMVFFPAIVTLLSLYGLASTWAGTPTLLGVLAGAAIGTAAAFRMEQRNPAEALPDGRLRLKGEWTSVVIVLAIFASHYVKTVAAIVSPAGAASAGFLFTMALVSALFSALLVVRTILRLRVAGIAMRAAA